MGRDAGRQSGWSDHLERLARIIPGLGRYQDREGLRETDKRVRTHLADRLDDTRRVLGESQRRVAEGRNLDRVPAMERIGRRLGTLADRIRYASYGFAGVFDLQKVRETELLSLHRLDVALADAAPVLQERIRGLAAAGESGFPEALLATEEALNQFEEKLDRRERAAGRL